MPSLIDLRRRIRSVKNTQQITKAMKMVSAAKLRRAQDSVVQARPFATLLREMLSSVLANVGQEDLEHPLLAKREEKRVLALVMSGDKGLCGGFNTKLFKAADQFCTEHGEQDLELNPIGRKGRDYYQRREANIGSEWINVFSTVEFDVAAEIGNKVIERFSNSEIDSVYLIYTQFKSALSSEPLVQKLLPVDPPAAGEAAADYIFQQPPQVMFESLLPRYVRNQVYQAMLESSASEHSARMAAMDAATRNAGEMIDSLTLHLNRIRQASITTEIIEVVSGAAAQE